jgi:hypothetical protein
MNQTVASNPPLATDLAETAAHRTDNALQGAKHAADRAAQSLQSGLDHLRDTIPPAVGRAAAQAEDMSRRLIGRSRQAAQTMQHRAADLGDAAAVRIRDQPMKAVLLAAAAGALATLLMQWLVRPGHSHRR